jgi:hypothetical protein
LHCIALPLMSKQLSRSKEGHDKATRTPWHTLKKRAGR